MYVCRHTFNDQFLLWLPATILHAVVCISLHKGCRSQTSYIFPVKCFKISQCRTKQSSSPTSPAINDIYIYAAKLGIQATTTVVRLCTAVSGHTSKGLAEEQQRVQIAPVCRHSRHRKSHLGKDTLRRGWLKHGNRVQLLLHAGKVGIGCHS